MLFHVYLLDPRVLVGSRCYLAIIAVHFLLRTGAGVQFSVQITYPSNRAASGGVPFLPALFPQADLILNRKFFRIPYV